MGAVSRPYGRHHRPPARSPSGCAASWFDGHCAKPERCPLLAERCLVDAGTRLPGNVDRRALASFVLTTMEGGVMLARTYRDVAMFDAAVGQLRDYFARLLTEGAALNPRRKPQRS